MCSAECAPGIPMNLVHIAGNSVVWPHTINRMSTTCARLRGGRPPPAVRFSRSTAEIGCRTASEAERAVCPDTTARSRRMRLCACIFTLGKNSYGHPDKRLCISPGLCLRHCIFVQRAVKCVCVARAAGLSTKHRSARILSLKP